MMARATQFRFRSASRPRFAKLALVLAASGLCGVACGSGNSHVPAGPKLGNTDKTNNGVISVDEPNIRGSIKGSTLMVNVPVTSLVEHDITGMLKLRLADVDGLTEHGVVELPYSLAAGESTIVSGALAAPASATTQSDFVESNVRIDDGRPGGLRVTRSLLYVLPLEELTVEGPSSVHKGREVSYRVRVQEGSKHQPISNRKVTFELRQNEKVVQRQTVSTMVTGDAQVRLTPKHPGNYKVLARLESQGVSTELEDPVAVSNDSQKLLLTTDKPIYQPGQIIHLRALSLIQGTNAPSAAAAVSFEIEDGKGNKLLKRPGKTDKYGVAATKFQLGSILNEGTFKVRVIQGPTISEKTVQVSHYALPKFAVTVKTADPWYAPGAEVRGSVDSSYFFGKAVSGSVLVAAYSLDVGETMFQQVLGSLDASGHYDFALHVPSTLPGLPLDQGNAAIELRVTVTDSAGQVVQKSLPVTVSARGMNLSLVPESTELVPGIENKLLVFASDPLGAPLAAATATVKAPDGSTLKATTDDYGQAEIAWTPDATTPTPAAFQADVALPGGKSASANFSFGAQSGSDHLVVRTDKSVYQVGDTVQVSVVSTQPAGNLYVDWINDGQAVDMRTLTATDGTAKFTMPLDASLIGSNRIDAYLVDEDGNVVRSGRTIFARTDAALKVAVSADKNVYAPGDPAKLTLSVTDENGAPKAAALGLQIVDEAVFALVDAKPGLLRTYFELNDQLASPSFELNAPASDLSELLFTDTAGSDKKKSAAAQRQTEGALAAMKNQTLTGISHSSLGDVQRDAVSKLQPSYTALRPTLLVNLTPRVAAAVVGLAKQNCTPSTYYCSSLNLSFIQALVGALEKSAIYDFWGNAYTFQDGGSQLLLGTLGPDEKAGTVDDSTFGFSYSDLGLPQTFNPGLTEGGGAAAGGAASTAPGHDSSDNGAVAPANSTSTRVRSDFPETLYVNPSVITDATGKATVDVSMADSITQWRVSALASSADGRLGGTESGLRVFQDFFIDVDFPASLTRGDEVEFPIAVYNYLETPQTVSLELDPGTWYTPLGTASASVSLQPGQVIRVSFPVRVDEVGLRTLTVKAVGDKLSDSVARSVRVVPDGKAFPSSDAGSLASGTVTASATFPAGSVAGSGTLYLDVFPAFLSQVVQGMDSILATPNGCFEQTPLRLGRMSSPPNT